MTPTLIERVQICDATWNEHISKSLQCVIYAQTYYLDAVCESWKALVWPDIQHPEIVMPIPIRKKWGFRIVYQPVFCQYLGLFSLKPLSDFQLESFLRFVSKAFSYISAYHFNPENSIKLAALATTFPALQCTPNHTHWLPLRNDYQKLKARYKQDRRKNLRRSNNYGWEIQKGEDISRLMQLFSENQTARIPGGVGPNAFRHLATLFKALQAKGCSEVYYALSDGQVHAGILIVKFAGRAIYLFNAADQKGRKGNARTFMLDQYFSANVGEGLIFDFESPEVEPIAKFYLSFGSAPVSFYAISTNELWFPLRQMQNWRKHFFKTRQGLF